MYKKTNRNKISKKNRKTNKKSNKKSNKKIAGGNHSVIIPNYSQNTLQHDPNYMQISSRNVMQYGSGKNKNKNKNKKGGGVFDVAANQLYNPISNFFNPSSNQWLIGATHNINSAPYVQPIAVKPYTL